MHCSETMLDAKIIRHYPVAICTLRHLWTSSLCNFPSSNARTCNTFSTFSYNANNAFYKIHQTQRCCLTCKHSNFLDCPFFLFKANSVLCLLIPELTWSACLLNPQLHISNFFSSIFTLVMACF